jgi:hypothetical protein
VAALTFYFDRNFGKRFPEALAMIKPPFTVEYHHSRTNRFPKNMPDDEWLEICGKNGWFGFSHDRKFHEVTVEAMAIRQHSVGVFYLPGASQSTWDKLAYFVRAYPKILERTSRTRPFLYRVHTSLRLEQIALP